LRTKRTGSYMTYNKTNMLAVIMKFIRAINLLKKSLLTLIRLNQKLLTLHLVILKISEETDFKGSLYPLAKMRTLLK